MDDKVELSEEDEVHLLVDAVVLTLFDLRLLPRIGRDSLDHYYRWRSNLRQHCETYI